MPAGRRAILWLSPAQVGLAREAARGAELDIIGAGSPERGQSGRVASELGSGSGAPASLGDLRAALAGADADLFWIASPGAFGATGSDEDAAAILAAHSRGARIATLEPIPAAATDLASRAWSEGVPRVIDIPAFVPLWPASLPPREAIASIGPVRTLALEWWGTSEQGSLASRLFAAMELVLRLLGEPESIDAAYIGPDDARGVHAVPGESLRGLTGDLTANLRLAGGRGAAIALSDRAARWGRSLSLIGPGGRIRVHDEALEWIGSDGRPVDEPAARPRRRRAAPAEGGPSPAAAALAEGLTRLLASGVPDDPRPDARAVLATCHAAMLSARTGQCESPATIKRIAGVA